MAERKLYVPAGNVPAPEPKVRQQQPTTVVLWLSDEHGTRVNPPVVTQPHPYWHQCLGEYLDPTLEQLYAAGWTAELVRLGA